MENISKFYSNENIEYNKNESTDCLSKCDYLSIDSSFQNKSNNKIFFKNFLNFYLLFLIYTIKK